MYKNGQNFHAGDGLVGADVDMVFIFPILATTIKVATVNTDTKYV